MPQIVQAIDIAAPPAAVWRAIANFGAVAAWAPAVRQAHCTTAAASGLGCERLITTSSGEQVREVVTAWEEGRSLAFQIPGGLARVVAFLQECWTVEASPSGARVTVDMEYRTRYGPLGAAAARLLVRPALARMLAENLAGLKAYVEGGLPAQSNAD